MVKAENKKYSIIDLETTGANAFGQKIIEIGIINYDGEKIEEVFSTLIHPEKFISHGITMITGITNEMVQDAPKFYEVAKKIVEMTEGRIFVAHNVFFDYRFLQREFQDLGFSFKRDVFCTCKTSRNVFPGFDSYSLKNLCKEFSIPRKAAHRALSDAEDCLEVFKRISNAGEIKTFKEEYDHLIPAQLQNFSFENYPETPGLYFMYDAAGELLYVGKSKNIRGRLKQHFKQFSGQQREQELKSQVTRVEFMECFHDLPTSLLELHFIKNSYPYYNRAGRRRNYRYGVRLNPPSEGHAPGDEIKVTKVIDDVPLMYCFGNRHAAGRCKDKMFQKVFGITPGDLNFYEQVKNLKKVLGPHAFYNKLKAHYEDKIMEIPDMVLKRKNWTLVIKNNSLKSIFIKNVGRIEINETPDMRMILLSSLRKTFKQKLLTPTPPVEPDFVYENFEY